MRKLYRKVKTFFLRLYVKAHLFTTTQRKGLTERIEEKAKASRKERS